jgi:HK97 family phage prohead protease
MKEDNHGLFVEGQLLLNIQKGLEAYNLLKAGALDGLSIGYQVVEGVRDRKTQLRTLTRLDLVEVSLVTFAANRKAKVTKLKSEEPLISKIRKTANTIRSMAQGRS